MYHTIYANRKRYEVSGHAAQRMLQRDVTEEMVIKTLEKGTLSQQPHGTDLYEYEISNDPNGFIIILQVVIDEDRRIIVTIMVEEI